MKNSILPYSVGALLYCPANHRGIAASLISERFGRHFSLAMCLEDTIPDAFVEEAEQQLILTLKSLKQAFKAASFFMPKIFIRIRRPGQILDLLERLEDAQELITGFIVPKFAPDNADIYINTILQANDIMNRKIYLMPILESPVLIDLRTRHEILYQLKEKLDRIEELALNIRVGGNDLCHAFGFRRSCRESIHSISAISSIFSDIITVFGMDYVVSGPVWEYYNGEGWDTGLLRELREDRLCGFTGKTVIHPRQIRLVNSAFQVSEKDLADARSILNWDHQSRLLVSGCTSAERMNEYKVHRNWAARILMLAEAYGTRPTSS